MHMKSWTRYMTDFQIPILEKMHEKIITIHSNQAIYLGITLILKWCCVTIFRRTPEGALEKRCFEICVQSTWQMSVDGSVNEFDSRFHPGNIWCTSSLERLFSRGPLVTVLVYFCHSKVLLFSILMVIQAYWLIFFQIKTWEAHSELCRASEVKLFAKMVNSLKLLAIFAKSSILDVLKASLNWS